MKGYKVFNADLTCRGFQFEIGKEYKHEGSIKICSRGFHFCTKASHCFSYYSFDPKNVVCEVEALGKTETHDEDSKVVTDHLKIIRQLTWDEVLKVSNEGANNTGHSNTGDSNTGDWNTGNRNTGYSNTGNSNTGNRNTGDWNTGNRNTGDWNTGDWNTGNRNTGYSNTGNSNTGNRNTGDSNTGYSNTGYSNTGYSNTGDWNTGNSNTGYSNTGNRNTGAFCTIDAPFPMFNKPSKWTEEDFKSSRAYSLMYNNVNTKMWIADWQMSNEEKEKFPAYKTAGGYIKDIPFKEAFMNAWGNFSEKDREAFKSLPNFDAEVFEQITGVKI